MARYEKKIKTILLDDFNFDCINNTANYNGPIEINHESNISYQCFCKKKYE